MAAPLIIPSKFTAIDSFTPVMRKMTASTTTFTNKTRAGFEMVGIAERKMRMGLQGSIKKMGKLGQLGAGFSAVMIGSRVVQKTIELDNSLKSVQAITGKTGSEFEIYRKEIDRVSESQSTFGSKTAKAFELVASAKPELLDNAKLLANVSENAILLRKASGMELEDAINATTTGMAQFNIQAEKSAMVTDALSAASKYGSSTIPQSAKALEKFGAVAYSANLNIFDSVALIDTLATKQLKGEQAGTQLKNVILKLKNAGLGFVDGQFNINAALQETRDKFDAIKDPVKRSQEQTKLFGLESSVAGEILLGNISVFEDFQKKVKEVGTTEEMASIMTSSLGEIITELTDSFDTATTTTNENNVAMISLKWILQLITQNMGLLIGVVGTAIGVYAAFKAITVGFTAVTWLMNTAQAVSLALQGKTLLFLEGNTAALVLYKVATLAMAGAQWIANGAMSAYTVVQWAANAALWAFPLTWIIAAIVGVIAAVAALIYYWDDLVAWMGEVWESFKQLGWVQSIISAFGALGDALSWVGDMFSNLWDWLSEIASAAWEPIQNVIDMFTGDYSASVNLDANAEAGGGEVMNNIINPDAAIETVRTNREENTTTKKSEVELILPDGVKAEMKSDTQDVPVRIGKTH